jgi:hypothetical protein
VCLDAHFVYVRWSRSAQNLLEISLCAQLVFAVL